MSIERVLLPKPLGFCSGAVRAIEIVNIALDLYQKPVYVRKAATMLIREWLPHPVGPNS
jgi:4-hydroxy-3-methylbut-2-enyl diphosphate reductase IspH